MPPHDRSTPGHRSEGLGNSRNNRPLLLLGVLLLFLVVLGTMALIGDWQL
ncbi:hypothetical protein [Nocardioides seonyuensis]|nr:hypothetical protein [Nocardioides seonyuensis]